MTKKETKQEVKNIYQRMNLVQQKVTYVRKNKPNGMKYSIVSHDDVTAKVRPSLIENGIIYYPTNLIYEQSGNRTQVTLELKFQNIHDKEDYMLVSCIGYGCDGQDKGPGKAVSYAVKYGLLKALGLETGDDADLDNVDHEEKQAEKIKEEEPKYPKKPKGSHKMDMDMRPCISAIMSTTSLEEFVQVKKDFSAPWKKIIKEWPAYMTELNSEEQTKSFNDQIKEHKERLEREDAVEKQQREDLGEGDDFVNPFQ